MTRAQRIAAQTVSIAVFGGSLLVGGLLLYYAVLNFRGDPGDAATDLLAWLLEGKADFLTLVGVVLQALPALTLSVAVRKAGTLTRFGVVTVLLLTVTFLTAAVANLVLVPSGGSPGSELIAMMADAGATQLAAFSLTYGALVLGLKIASNWGDGEDAPH